MTFELDAQVVAGLVLCLERDPEWALHGRGHSLQREATLLARLGLVAALGDDRVHDCEHVVLAALEHEDAPDDTDLRRREADTACVVHELAHAVDEALEVVVELRHLVRAHPQDGIAELPDLGERELSSSPCLGVELFILDHFAFDLLLLGHPASVRPVRRRQTSWGSTSTTAVRPSRRIAGA